MRNAGYKHYINGAVLLVIIVMALSCSGDGTTPDPHFNDPNGVPGTQGTVGTGGTGGGGTVAGGSPVVGILPGAPLGTDPSVNTQEIGDVIETTKVESGTSGLRSTSENDRVLWVALTKRGDTPDPGLPSPPIAEGDEIDLHIRYLVFENELSISRQWILEEAGLNYIEPSVAHESAGTYHAVFPFTLNYGSKSKMATFKGVIGPLRSTSIVVIPDMHDYREVEFEIINTPNLLPIYYPPSNPDDDNDTKKHGKGCLPDEITVTFNGTSVYVEVFEEDDSSGYDISNVILEFDDGTSERWESGDRGREAEFFGTGENDGKTIVRCWVKAGCNESGYGRGYGEMFELGVVEEMAMAQFAWEDDTLAPDYDYNDFIGRMRIAEIRDLDNNMVQMNLTARAMARATNYDASWQFNIGASFPGATNVIAIVDQYYADGTRHGNQRIYLSAGGMSIPIFAPTRLALPNPEGTYTTNGLAGTDFVEGDYAEVTVILHEPQAQGTYSSIPYEPQLLVDAGNDTVWTINLWSNPGDELNEDGMPQAFIVPDTYAWPLEGEPITNVYPEFEGWINWINGEGSEPTPPWWQWDPTELSQYFKRELFN